MRNDRWKKIHSAGEMKEFSRFLNGDVRADGWRSKWRIEQDRRRREDAVRQAKSARDSQVTARKVSAA